MAEARSCITAHALYTDPPLGCAGMTEAGVRKTGKPALISTMATRSLRARFGQEIFDLIENLGEPADAVIKRI
jgi:hypothetical protein